MTFNSATLLNVPADAIFSRFDQSNTGQCY
jgi:hypothetical protein